MRLFVYVSYMYGIAAYYIVDEYRALPYIHGMTIDFDSAKDAANQDKHGISLFYAETVLKDTNRIDVLDARFDYSEDRFISYAQADNRVWVCIFTMRGDVCRVISLRKANDRETERYRTASR